MLKKIRTEIQELSALTTVIAAITSSELVLAKAVQDKNSSRFNKLQFSFYIILSQR